MKRVVFSIMLTITANGVKAATEVPKEGKEESTSLWRFCCTSRCETYVGNTCLAACEACQNGCCGACRDSEHAACVLLGQALGEQGGTNWTLVPDSPPQQGMKKD